MKKFLLFGALDLLGRFLKSLPHPLLLALARALAWLASVIDKRRKFVLLSNLNFAYGGSLSKAEANAILKQNYLNIILNALFFFILAVSRKEDVLARTKILGAEIITDALERGERAICVSGHFGNWEYLTPAFTCLLGFRTAAVARMTPYPLVNAYLRRVRERFDIEIIDKKGAAIALARALKRLRIVGVVSDQNTADSDGVLVKFYGKEVRHSPVASLLALKSGAKIIHCFAEYSANFKQIIIRVYPPLELPKSGDLQADVLALTQAQSDLLERVVRENPKEWLWFHKKFKNRYPEIYERSERCKKSPQ